MFISIALLLRKLQTQISIKLDLILRTNNNKLINNNFNENAKMYLQCINFWQRLYQISSVISFRFTVVNTFFLFSLMQSFVVMICGGNKKKTFLHTM